MAVANKETYKKLCETEGERIPLFLQHWWMEAVCCGKQWDVALAYNKDGSIAGALPYLISSKFGLRYILQPQLTQYNGPWYNCPDGLSVRKRLLFQYDVDRQLIDSLEKLKLAFFSQNFAPSLSNVQTWLPYYWAGYSQTTRYSYRFDPIPEKETFLKLMSKRDRRRKIEAFLDSVSEDYAVSPDEFTTFYLNYWMSLGKRCVLTGDFVKRLCETVLERGSGMIVGLRQRGNDQLLGAKFVVYDSSCAYSLMSAFLRTHDYIGISSCLVWFAVCKLANISRAYDFEGSMDKGIEYFYRSFGATPVPYHHVWKCFNPMLKPFVAHFIAN